MTAQTYTASVDMIENDRFEAVLKDRLEKLKPFERDLVSEIWEQRNRYVQWPKEAHLLWPGETRKKRHSYPSI